VAGTGVGSGANLLHGSRINPKLSAHAQLHGNFDFNRTPLAPPGTRVLVHVKPTKRTTWLLPHGADGWYTGPALESYWCYTVWMWDTRSTRICDTLTWFPTKTTMPLASSNNLILAGIKKDIVHALHNLSPGSPLAPLTDSHHNALTELKSILTSIIKPDNEPPPAPSPLVHCPDPPLRVADPPSDIPSLPAGLPTSPLPLRVLPCPPWLGEASCPTSAVENSY
jgi:hypothetical protein